MWPFFLHCYYFKCIGFAPFSLIQYISQKLSFLLVRNNTWHAALFSLHVCFLRSALCVLLWDTHSKISGLSELEWETKCAWKNLTRAHIAENQNTSPQHAIWFTLLFKNVFPFAYSDWCVAYPMSAPNTSYLIGAWHSGARPKGQDLFRLMFYFLATEKKCHCSDTHFFRNIL